MLIIINLFQMKLDGSETGIFSLLILKNQSFSYQVKSQNISSVSEFFCTIRILTELETNEDGNSHPLYLNTTLHNYHLEVPKCLTTRHQPTTGCPGW